MRRRCNLFRAWEIVAIIKYCHAWKCYRYIWTDTFGWWLCRLFVCPIFGHNYRTATNEERFCFRCKTYEQKPHKERGMMKYAEMKRDIEREKEIRKRWEALKLPKLPLSLWEQKKERSDENS